MERGGSRCRARAHVRVSGSRAYASICNKVHMSMKCGTSDKAVAHSVARQEFGPHMLRAHKTQRVTTAHSQGIKNKKKKGSLGGKRKEKTSVPLEVGRSSRGLEMTQGCPPDSSLTEEPSEPPLSKAADFTRASLAARLHPIKAGTRGCRVKCHHRTRRLPHTRWRTLTTSAARAVLLPRLFFHLRSTLRGTERGECVYLCVSVCDESR